MLKTLPRSAPLDEIAATLERDGGLILEGLLDTHQVDGLLEDFEPHLDAADWGDSQSSEPNDFFGLTTKRLHGAVAKSAHVADILASGLLVDLAGLRLGVGTRTQDIRVSTIEVMAIGPGEAKQSFHRDSDAWPFVPLQAPRPEILTSANIALHDFTEENGATYVVPGSHKWPRDRQPQRDEVCQAVMPRGSALLYSGEVIHSGGDNHTEGVRTGLYFGFIASWMRPTENHLQTNGPEALAALPEATQRLLNVVPNGFSLIA